MKTMKHGEEIRKVKEDQVKDYLAIGWNYCPRSEWKTKVRDVMKAEKTEEVVEEKEKKKGNPKGKAKKENK